MDRIIYNRVGKCGSRYMINLIRSLAARNHFTIYDSKYEGNLDPTRRKMTLNEQVEFTSHINKQLRPPFIFHGHFHFVDFNKYYSTVPVHINLIRDPLERFVSAYYYKRFGDGRNRTWNFHGTVEERDRTLNDCILMNYSECTDPNRLLYIIPYFCGQTKGCRGARKASLKRAAYNVDEKYLVVGILEDIPSFIKVLEKLLPDFFKGAYEIATKTGEGIKNRESMKTKKKKDLSSKAQEILKKRLRLEYRFYNYVRTKFNRLKKHLHIT